MKPLTFAPGTHIDNAAKELCAAAIERGTDAIGTFNGVTLTASPTDGWQDVAARYNREQEERSAAYRASPEGQAAAARSERERADLQGEHDTLVGLLPRLDFGDRVAVLDWLCALQPASDRIGVKVDRAAIVAAFEAKGFKTGVNCAADYRPDDPDNSFRWLVGQALDFLQHGYGIHAILLKFAAEWKERFPGGRA